MESRGCVSINLRDPDSQETLGVPIGGALCPVSLSSDGHLTCDASVPVLLGQSSELPPNTAQYLTPSLAGQQGFLPYLPSRYSLRPWIYKLTTVRPHMTVELWPTTCCKQPWGSQTTTTAASNPERSASLIFGPVSSAGPIRERQISNPSQSYKMTPPTPTPLGSLQFPHDNSLGSGHTCRLPIFFFSAGHSSPRLWATAKRRRVADCSISTLWINSLCFSRLGDLCLCPPRFGFSWTSPPSLDALTAPALQITFTTLSEAWVPPVSNLSLFCTSDSVWEASGFSCSDSSIASSGHTIPQAGETTNHGLTPTEPHFSPRTQRAVAIAMDAAGGQEGGSLQPAHFRRDDRAGAPPSSPPPSHLPPSAKGLGVGIVRAEHSRILGLATSSRLAVKGRRCLVVLFRLCCLATK